MENDNYMLRYGADGSVTLDDPRITEALESVLADCHDIRLQRVVRDGEVMYVATEHLYDDETSKWTSYGTGATVNDALQRCIGEIMGSSMVKEQAMRWHKTFSCWSHDEEAPESVQRQVLLSVWSKPGGMMSGGHPLWEATLCEHHYTDAEREAAEKRALASEAFGGGYYWAYSPIGETVEEVSCNLCDKEKKEDEQ